MKKFLSVFTILALILTLLTPVISAQSVPELPENTPSIIAAAINSGKIEYNDDIALKLELYDRIYSALINFEETIKVFDLYLKWGNENFQKLSNCYSYIINNSILYYILNPSLKYTGVSYDKGKTWYVNEIKIDYTDYDLTVVKNQIRTTQKAVCDIAKKVPQNISDIAKLIYVHDYLESHFDYDLSLQNRSVYTFLTEKVGVCSAYALTFAAIMNELGIPVTSAYYESPSDERENHQWNIVLLDGNFYHIDCTWDDPVGSDYGKYSHNYFLISDASLYSKESSHINYYTLEADFGLDISCTDNSFDSGYLWNSTETAFAYYDGAFYNISDTTTDNKNPCATIYKTVDFKHKQNIITLKSDIWYIEKIGNSYSYHPGFYTGFDIIGSQLYFNDSHSVKYYDLSNHKSGTVFENDDNIFSFHYLGKGKFGYTTHNTDSKHSHKQNIITLTDKGHIYNNTSSGFNSDLAAMRKYILGDHTDNLCLAKGDISGDDCEITVQDFVALKKLAAQG